MKMKKIFSGIIAAVMSIAVMAMPITSFAGDPPEPDLDADKGIIQINHAGTNGSYTAYPIFVGDEVKPETKTEKDKDGNETEVKTGRLLIKNPQFHSNLETSMGMFSRGITSSYEVAQKDKSTEYGLWKYLQADVGWSQLTLEIDNDGNLTKISFYELIKKYDLSNAASGLTGFSSIGGKNNQAEAIANLLNLTSSVAETHIVPDNKMGSAFYSAFAEAARMFMVDNATLKEGTNANTWVELPENEKKSVVSYEGTIDADNKTATIKVDEPGYYLVEYTPADYMVKVQDKDEKGNPKVDENGDPVWVKDSKGNPVEVVNEKYANYPRAVIRALVLVGKKSECGIATINSKDTENIASVDIKFYDITGTKTTSDGKDVYTFPEKIEKDKLDEKGEVVKDEGTGNAVKETVREGKWAKNVSAGNGDYVNCRVEITLPGNFEAYDQYYLAVPIMYGYNVSNTGVFDPIGNKSITRQGGLDNIKVYFLDNNNNKKLIIKDPTKGYDDKDNSTDLASEIFGEDKNHNALFEIKGKDDKISSFANDKKKDSDAADSTKQDDFIAAETFVISDIANMLVRDDKNAVDDVGKKVDTQSLKSNYTADGWGTFVIEFPVKFERFNADTLNSGAAAGPTSPGFASNNLNGDDLLMKNYISARVVYSNNPNLKALEKDPETGNYYTTGEKAPYDKTSNPNGVKLYLDTTKEIGSIHNPIATMKQTTSANIVTYRLRLHATTDDLAKICKAGGLEGVEFVLRRGDKEDNYEYAVVKQLGTNYLSTYDRVSGFEELSQTQHEEAFGEAWNGGTYPSNTGSVLVYKITGWEKSTVTEADGKKTVTYPTGSTLKTCNANPNTYGYANNNSGRFEIIGLAPGDYTVVALVDTLKTSAAYENNIGSNTNVVEYKLPKETGKTNLKNEYRFSFAPTLSEKCEKVSYDTHYAPIQGTIKQSDYTALPEKDKEANTLMIVPDAYYDNTIASADILITDYNLKWYDMDGNVITREDAKWWLGEREDVGLMSMRVTYIRMGLNLPVTGGIGTFIFFAVGGALVVISTVAIVTKFRMKREQL